MSDENRCQMKEMDENTEIDSKPKKKYHKEFVYILNG